MKINLKSKWENLLFNESNKAVSCPFYEYSVYLYVQELHLRLNGCPFNYYSVYIYRNFFEDLTTLAAMQTAVLSFSRQSNIACQTSKHLYTA